MSNRLSAREIEAVLAVAGDADATETISSCFEEDEVERMIAAFERGMEKLRRQLGRRTH